MLFLLRKIRRKLMQNNKITSYLLYALGEILLVVIGIFIAVQLNNWNQERKNEVQGQVYRTRMINDLKTDLSSISTRRNFFDVIMNYGLYATQHLKEEDTENIEEQWKFVFSAFQTSQMWSFKTTSTTYNELQSTGLLPYLGNDSLLARISIYYIDSPEQLSQLVGGVQTYRDFIRGIVPIHIQEFVWNECFEAGSFELQTFKPCSVPDSFEDDISEVYHIVKHDPNFKRMLTRRLSTIAVRDEVYDFIYNYAENLIKNLSE